VHAAGAVHATPLRELNVAPVGFGVGWMAQAVPFQRSANIFDVPELPS
jgi:hypothetical protein